MSRRSNLLSLGGIALVGALALGGCAAQPAADVTQPATQPAVEATTPAPAQESTPAEAAVTKLVIKDEVVGKGAAAKSGDKVTVNYTGWLTDGTQFDTSIGKQPFPFTIGAGQVIPGWDQGVAGMKVGGKRKLTIPSDLGYGAQGAGGVIPPNATLVFEVELLSIGK